MVRITREELNQSLASPSKTEQKTEESQDKTTIAYTLGLQEVDEADSTAYAKQTENKGKRLYYVKQNRYGSLYNPQGMYSERNQAKMNRYGAKWSFKEVTQKTFDQYLKFLETKNEAWLSNAEREMA